MVRKIALLSFAILLMIAETVFAGEVTVMDPPKDCPQKADVQGHRALVYVDANQDCTSDQKRSYGYRDERLGIEFDAQEFGSWIYLPTIVQPAAEDPADSAHLCVRLFPNGAVRELIVPAGRPCTRGGSHYWRRYYNGQACIFPANYCAAIDSLSAEGQRRARLSIELAKRGSKVAGK